MISQNKKIGLESLTALNKVAKANNDHTLTKQESERNIDYNIISIAHFTGMQEKDNGYIDMKITGLRSGLLLTKDGWIITAYHNIAHYIDDWEKIKQQYPPTNNNCEDWLQRVQKKYGIIDQNSDCYPLDITSYISEPSFDIAIIKAVIPKMPEPVRFHYKIDNLKMNENVTLMGLSNQKVYTGRGKVIAESHDVENGNLEIRKTTPMINDSFVTNAIGFPGLSGGPFMTEGGEFAGTGIYFYNNVTPTKGFAAGAKVCNIMNLIKRAADEGSKNTIIYRK